MDKERLEMIRENAYTRCSIASISGIGITAPDREELELIDEVDRLNDIINELEKYLEKTIIDGGTRGSMTFWYRQIYDYLQELKRSGKE